MINILASASSLDLGGVFLQFAEIIASEVSRTFDTATVAFTVLVAGTGAVGRARKRYRPRGSSAPGSPLELAHEPTITTPPPRRCMTAPWRRPIRYPGLRYRSSEPRTRFAPCLGV